MLMLGEDNEYSHYRAEIFHERIDSVGDMTALNEYIDHSSSFLAPIVSCGQ